MKHWSLIFSLSFSRFSAIFVVRESVTHLRMQNPAICCLIRVRT